MEYDFRSYAMPLIDSCERPNMEIVNIFRHFYNIEGKKIYYIPQKKLYKYGIEEFIHALSNSPWKTAFMKGAFILPLPYYWIYRLLRK